MSEPVTVAVVDSGVNVPHLHIPRDGGLVRAFELEGRSWQPGCMDGVVGVCLGPEQPRESVTAEDRGGRTVLRASPYPRPIPGVPKERNLNGISVAVANATGRLAAALAGHEGVRTAHAAVALLGRAQ